MSILAGCLILFFVVQAVVCFILTVAAVDEKSPGWAVFYTVWCCISVVLLVSCGAVLGGGWWTP